MTFESYEQRFRILAANAGYSEENTIKCLNYARPLIEKELPVIFNTANLSAYVGYKKSYIKKAVLYTPYFYRTFRIKKANGKFRVLREPLPSLKEIQIWILENILEKLPVSRFSKAYVKGRNILDNVKFHKNKDYVLTLDIENFFGNVKRENIETIFLKLGYSSNVSNLLSKICSYEGSLPQGAPTSPALSNIYMVDFDEKVASYCQKLDIRYTRYADDMTFSCNGKVPEVQDFVKKELEVLGLKINENKTRVLGRNEPQIVTGVIVNKVVQLPKAKRDKIRQEVYYVTEHGLQQHLTKIQNTKENYLKHLLGRIEYALFLNPRDRQMIKYRMEVSKLIRPNENLE